RGGRATRGGGWPRAGAGPGGRPRPRRRGPSPGCRTCRRSTASAAGCSARRARPSPPTGAGSSPTTEAVGWGAPASGRLGIAASFPTGCGFALRPCGKQGWATGLRLFLTILGRIFCQIRNSRPNCRPGVQGSDVTLSLPAPAFVSMERLKSAVPADIRRAVGEGTTRDLPSTTSLLLAFLDDLPLFHQVIGELADPELALCRKDKGRAAELKGRGNACFSRREFEQALGFYSQALRYAPISSDGTGDILVPALYVNRASTMHKLGLLEECLRDCDRAISVSPNYAKV
uniref:Uncharacterized protein n=1 Tax=Aegilops tauschii subsp. strangulata TaxID=200361 RepID=A0A452YJ54_AEGTS